MFFALEVMVMHTLMGREKLFNRATLSTNQEAMVFVFIMTLTCTPFTKRWNMVRELLLSQEIKYSIDRDGIDRQSLSYLVSSKSTLIFLKKTQYILSCFCLSHVRHCSNKIASATLLQ